MSEPIEAAETAQKRPSTRRGGRWVYGDHEGLNPGWRLDDTNLVLDFDPHSGAASVRGCWILWVDGQDRDPIDHYLDGAMEYVENHVLPPGFDSPEEGS